MPKKINHTTPQHQTILFEIEEIRKKLGLNEDPFVRKYLPFSPTTYYRLLTDQYTGNTENNMAKASNALGNLRAEMAALAHKRAPREIYRTRQVRGIESAVNKARTKTNENRLVFFLAPTGGGKTTVCEHIAAKYDAPVIEATEAWRTSYLAGCACIASAFGTTDSLTTSRKAEAAMLMQLSKRRSVLVIDEGNTFGPHTANMLKLILNRTETVVLVAAIPYLFNCMRRQAWAESSQLIRRATAIIQSDRIRRDDLALMFPEGTDDAVLDMVTKAANQFGHFDMAVRVAEELLDREVTLDSTREAINKTMRCISVNPTRFK